MPRTATQEQVSRNEMTATTIDSFPPPMAGVPSIEAFRGSAPQSAPSYSSNEASYSSKEAEALAAVAALSITARGRDDSPPKAVMGTVVALGVLLASMVLLALLVTV